MTKDPFEYFYGYTGSSFHKRKKLLKEQIRKESSIKNYREAEKELRKIIKKATWLHTPNCFYVEELKLTIDRESLIRALYTLATDNIEWLATLLVAKHPLDRLLAKKRLEMIDGAE